MIFMLLYKELIINFASTEPQINIGFFSRSNDEKTMTSDVRRILPSKAINYGSFYIKKKAGGNQVQLMFAKMTTCPSEDMTLVCP